MSRGKENRGMIRMVNYSYVPISPLSWLHVKIEATPCKRGRPKKAATRLSDRYPALNVNDDISPEEEKETFDALSEEMRSAKPRREVFLPLMRKTFVMRRHYILHNAASVRHIIRDYPALKEASAVSKML